MSAPTLAERASRRYAGLGTRLIWIGGILLLAMAMTIDLATTIDLLGRIADPVPILTAWIVLVIADAAILIVTHILGAHLPNWMFWLWVAALAIVLGLDLAATRHVENPGAALSVGVSAAFSLMLAVVTRPSFQIIPVAAALTAVTGAVWVLTPAYAAPNAADAVFTLCRMLLPVVVAALVCDEFRRLMRREMEEALSQASVAAPRLTLGVEASEQLARLDLAAESLLGAVADGRMPLPLSAEVAKRAGVLATELRLHLLASRSKTWLALAIEESTLLSQEIQIDDPSSSAGLLGTRQRAALLSALWLLHDGRVASGQRPDPDRPDGRRAGRDAALRDAGRRERPDRGARLHPDPHRAGRLAAHRPGRALPRGARRIRHPHRHQLPRPGDGRRRSW